MLTFVTFLVFCQALGALVGAGTAVWGELAYVHAMRDGHVSKAEKAHLAVIGRGLRFGMSLLLLASLGLVVVAYVLQAPLPPAFTASYWILIGLACLILGVSWAMSRKYMRFTIGSAIAFSAWWFLVYLTAGQLPTATVGATVLFFIVSTGIFASALIANRYLFGR